MLLSVMRLERLVTRRLNAAVRRRTWLSWLAGGTARTGSWIAAGLLILQSAHGLTKTSGTLRGPSALRAFLAVGVVYLVTFAVGRVVRRARPFADDPETITTVQHSPDRSFPSRHVASACAMAVVTGPSHSRLAWSYV